MPAPALIHRRRQSWSLDYFSTELLILILEQVRILALLIYGERFTADDTHPSWPI